MSTNLGNDRQAKSKGQSARWVDSIKKMMSAQLGDLKGELGERLSWKRSIYMVPKNQHNQSIKSIQKSI